MIQRVQVFQTNGQTVEIVTGTDEKPVDDNKLPFASGTITVAEADDRLHIKVVGGAKKQRTAGSGRQHVEVQLPTVERVFNLAHVLSYQITEVD